MDVAEIEGVEGAGMKEYIEREAVHSIIEQTSTFAFTRGGMHDKVNSLSAADVAPVRHGKWDSNSIAIVCSECGRAFNLVEMFAHYCPWCGALMDGKEADHD